MTARLIIGDVLDVLSTLKEDSVDLVITSPPFLALRSYLPADHPDKAKEIGSEPTPGEFIDALLDVTEALDRVLAPHGSICIELGDTYSGSGGAGGDYGADGLREGTPAFIGSKRQGNQRNDKVQMAAQGIIGTTSGERSKANPVGWPEAKSLCLVPELYRIALVYGRNPLTGRETPRWRVRNVVRWHRPNPPVGALGDKFRPATSDVVVACKSRTRYFDLDAVRVPGASFDRDNESKGNLRAAKECPEDGSGWMDGKPLVHNPAGAPPLDTWIIPTAPYKGSHYATFPPDLVVKPVLSMCPEWVCTLCGEPSRRITDSCYVTEPDDSTRDKARPNDPDIRGSLDHPPEKGWERNRTTLGWTECDCLDTDGSKWRRGVVLDPFAGSGTTLAVATGHGRNAIGIDLDERNADLCRERIGMFLEVAS